MRGIEGSVACAALIAFASSASAKGPTERECLDANDRAQALPAARRRTGEPAHLHSSRVPGRSRLFAEPGSVESISAEA
jgi:hypothetical protein